MEVCVLTWTVHCVKLCEVVERDEVSDISNSISNFGEDSGVNEPDDPGNRRGYVLIPNLVLLFWRPSTCRLNGALSASVLIA